jgi:hypothetical protein
MGLFVYTQKGSIISTVDLPTTEIIEPNTSECCGRIVNLRKGAPQIFGRIQNQFIKKSPLKMQFERGDCSSNNCKYK